MYETNKTKTKSQKTKKKTIMTTAKMQHIGRKKIGFLSQNVCTVE